MTVTELHPYRLQHVQDCDTMALGRVLVGLVRAGAQFIPGPDTIKAMSDEPENRGHCRCAALALGRVENQLRLARKAQRYIATGDGPAIIAQLTAERDAIKRAMA